jgi:hypothetical protein
MPLSRALRSVLLTRPCPHCGHKLVKKGAGFKPCHVIVVARVTKGSGFHMKRSSNCSTSTLT